MQLPSIGMEINLLILSRHQEVHCILKGVTEDKSCVYRKISGSTITFLILYVDNIRIIKNDVRINFIVKTQPSSHFSMKVLREAFYILRIQIYKDRSKRMLGLS
ncbi:unnamed protein product [Musa textilis]